MSRNVLAEALRSGADALRTYAGDADDVADARILDRLADFVDDGFGAAPDPETCPLCLKEPSRASDAAGWAKIPMIQGTPKICADCACALVDWTSTLP